MGTRGWQRGPRYRPGKAAGTPAPPPLSTGGAERGAQSPLTLTPPCPTGLSGYSKAPALLGAYGRPPVPEYPWGWGPYVPGALPLPASKLPAALYPPPFYPPLPPPPPPPPAAAAAPPLPGPGPGPERPLEPGSDSELEVTDGGGGGSSGDEAGSPPPAAAAAPPATAAPRWPWQGSGTQLSAQRRKRGTLTPPRMVGGTHTTAWTPQDPGGGLADRA